MNGLSAYGSELWLLGQIDWVADSIKVVLVDTSGAYTPNRTTDQFLAIVPVSTRIATSGTLTSRTAAQGVADADDVSFGTVSGNAAQAAWIFKDTGDAATSPLLFFVGTAVGLPVNPDGNPIKIKWDNGDYKIFSIFPPG